MRKFDLTGLLRSKTTGILRSGLELTLSDLNPDVVNKLIEKLTWTIKPSEFSPITEPQIIKGYVLNRIENRLTIPRWFAWNGSLPMELQDQRSDGRQLALNDIPIKLRNEKQQLFMDKMWAKLCHSNSTYGVAAPGSGKTILALELLRRYSKSTAVIVHKDFLMNQWHERIKQFLPSAKVGFCQQDQCDTGNEFDIVICMVQSVARRDYGEKFLSSFGLLILDEGHRMGSEFWSSVLFKFNAKAVMMLSATPERKDGMQELQYLHCCEPTVIISEPDMLPRIETRITGVTLPDKKFRWNGKPNWARMINALTEHERRNTLIGNDILKAAKSGRKILVISERLDQLAWLGKYITSISPEIKYGDYTGGHSQEELNLAAQNDVIFATFQLVTEGLDIPKLDVLIVASPRGDLIQAVGRILRSFPDKKEPIVVDYQDSVPELLGLGKKRRRIFSECGYKIMPARSVC